LVEDLLLIEVEPDKGKKHRKSQAERKETKVKSDRSGSA
jgi:hypothetical protein